MQGAPPAAFDGANHVRPHAGRGNALTHHVAGGEIFRAVAQKMIQSVHLAGGSGEKHGAGLQKLPNLPVYAPQVALHVFCPPEIAQILRRKAGDVPQALPVVQRRAEHHAAAFQRVCRDQRKYAAGGGVLADHVVPVPGGEHRREGAALGRVERRADCRAPPAVNTFFRVDQWVGKALPVRLHGNGVLRADGGAGGAAGAVRPSGQFR
ncbi:hypothetical protein SDC9_184054 [bioreactor metagenome]|uniref:Uncharacterized protein n=1 Tax=bioreactor metagenome TaxID=1076179 RepID=A0A645HBZ3_9ZZZZ